MDEMSLILDVLQCWYQQRGLSSNCTENHAKAVSFTGHSF